MSGILSRAVMRPGIVRLVLVVVPIQIPKLALMAVWTWMLVLALILRVRPVVTLMSHQPLPHLEVQSTSCRKHYLHMRYHKMCPVPGCPRKCMIVSKDAKAIAFHPSSMERHGKRLSYPIIPGTRAGLDAVTPMTFIFLTTMEKSAREENSAIPTVMSLEQAHQ